MKNISNLMRNITTGQSLVVLAVFGVLVSTAFIIPNRHNDAKAEDVVCGNMPTDNNPHLNYFPIKWDGTNTPVQNSNGTYTCYDFPALVARTNNNSFPTSQSQFNNGITAHSGDEVQVRVYIHNAAPQNGPDSTIARNVAVHTSYSATANGASVNVSFGGSNTNTVSSSARINLGSGESLELIPNSGEMYRYNGALAQSNFQIGNNTWNLPNDMPGCFEHSRFIFYKFRVVGTAPTGNLTITKEVRNVSTNGSFSTNAVAKNNETVEYRITTRATGATVNNVRVTDTGANGVSQIANTLRLNGATISGNLSSGVSLGSLNTSTPGVITYQGRVTTTACNTQLVNTARATGDNVSSVQAQATVTTQCDNQPQPVYCSPNSQTVEVGQTAYLSATGGNGSFSWSAAGGNPSSGTGSSFSTTYNSVGTKTVTVSSNGRSANCSVIVSQTPPPPQNVYCSPNSQTVEIGQTAYLTATGGNGNFSWQATSGNPSTGTGPTFSTSYSSSGTKTVTVSSNGRSANCSVIVNEAQVQPVYCSPNSQTVEIGQSAFLSASGGNGNFTWSAPSGSPSNGSGVNFNTSYGTSGTKTVTVSSNGRSANCSVIVNEVQVPQVYCSPNYQTVDVDQSAFLTASGGNGSYFWQAAGGSPSTGNGSSFSTSYSSSGTKTVTVSSNGRSASCTVYVNAVQNQNVYCSPGNQNVDVNNFASFSANGGNGSFYWNAPNGSPSTGSGSSFSTRYNYTGNFTVTVSSGSQTAYCYVHVNDIIINTFRSISVQKQVRNITDGTGYSQSVNADGGDRVGFEIVVRNDGSDTLYNTRLDDSWNTGLSVDSSTIRVDGNSVYTGTNSNSLSTINLGTLYNGQSKRITFEASVTAYSSTTIQNLARARADNTNEDQDDAYVYVSVNTGNPNTELSKKVRNDRTGSEGTNVNADREDYLTYTLTVRNTGSASVNYTVTDDLSGVLAYADMVDLAGGSLNGNTISYPQEFIGAGQTITHTFRVRVKFHLEKSRSFTLQNTFGNLVIVNIPGDNYVAPPTGASGLSATVFAGLITSGFLAIQKRKFLLALIKA